MASSLDVEALKRQYALEAVGTTLNTDYFRLDDGVLVAIPHDGSKDDGKSAASNREAQIAYFEKYGKKGGVVIFFDRMTSQDKDARQIYEGMNVALTCTALVGGTMLTRAMFSFFLGISRPKVPIRLFKEMEPAVAWIREVNQTANRTLEVSS